MPSPTSKSLHAGPSNRLQSIAQRIADQHHENLSHRHWIEAGKEMGLTEAQVNQQLQSNGMQPLQEGMYILHG